jgi:hypothetical protein
MRYVFYVLRMLIVVGKCPMPAIKAYGGVELQFRSLNSSCGCRRVVSFMPWPLYSWPKNPRFPLTRRPSGPQRWSGHLDVEKHFLYLFY